MILASAGAITKANSSGVASGARISRGVCALSEIRRRARVAQAAGREAPAGARGRASGVAAGAAVTVVMVVLLVSCRGSGSEPTAGQLQVDVVEGGLTGGHGLGVDAQARDGGDGVPSGMAAEGDGKGRADGERVACCQAAGAHRGQRAVRILAHP